jgi:hypothetical protein
MKDKGVAIEDEWLNPNSFSFILPPSSFILALLGLCVGQSDKLAGQQ